MKRLTIILVSLLITGLYCVVVSIIPLVILFDIFFPNNNFFSFLLCIVVFMTICIPFLGVYVIDKISLQKDEKEKPEDKKSQK